MNIIIDNQPIDFELENEKNIADVVSAIMTWLNKNGRIVSNISLDGVPLEDQKLKLDIPLNQNLSFQTADYDEVFRTTLNELLGQLQLLSKALQANNFTLISSVISIDSIIENLKTVIPSPDLPILIAQLKAIEKIKDNQKKIDSTLSSIKIFQLRVIERINEISQPLKELFKVKEFLQKLLPEFTKVPIQLQTGESSKALATVSSFTEVIQKFTRLAIYLSLEEIEKHPIGEKNLPDFLEELMPLLSEMEDGFNKQDTILIGDLMEYEMAPRVINLIKFVDSVAKID